jgi:hypothetical protein
MLPLIIGGVLVLLLVGGAVGGGIWWYTSSKSSRDKDKADKADKEKEQKEKEQKDKEEQEKSAWEDLGYVHEDAVDVTCIRLADVWASPEVRKAVAAKENTMDARYGVRPSDVERVTVVLMGDGTRYTIFRTKENIDQGKVKTKTVGGDKAKEASYKDKKYLVQDVNVPNKRCVYFAGNRVFLYATSEQIMQKALDGYPRKKKDGAISTVLQRHAEGKVAMSHVNEKKVGEPLTEVDLVTINGNQATLTATATYSSQELAEREAKAAQEQIDAFRKGLESQPNLTPELQRTVAALKALRITQNGKELQATATTDVEIMAGGFIVNGWINSF